MNLIYQGAGSKPDKLAPEVFGLFPLDFGAIELRAVRRQIVEIKSSPLPLPLPLPSLLFHRFTVVNGAIVEHNNSGCRIGLSSNVVKEVRPSPAGSSIWLRFKPVAKSLLN